MKKWGCKDISLRHDNLPDPSRSSLIFFKLFLPLLAVNRQSIIYRLPSILCRQQRISPPFPLKTMRFTPNFQLNWNKFPCCLWRIAKHFRHREKVKGLIFNSPASLPCWFSHVSYQMSVEDINENIDLHEGLISLVLFWCYFPIINEVTRCFI